MQHSANKAPRQGSEEFKRFKLLISLVYIKSIACKSMAKKTDGKLRMIKKMENFCSGLPVGTFLYFFENMFKKDLTFMFFL